MATWDFDLSSPAVTSITGSGAPNLNGQDAIFGSSVGVPNPDPPGRYPQGNPTMGKAYSGNGWSTGGSPNLNDYLQFCVDTDPGTVFTPGEAVGIQFDERRSSTGPREFEVRASTNDFASFTSLGVGSMPDPDLWRSQGPYSFNIPASPVVTEVCFRIYGFDATGPAGTWRFDNVQISGPSALPVEWLRFEARAEGNAVALAWATASETNSAYFEVERSVDGARYEAIGRVPGAGNSAVVQTYGFTDPAPLPGTGYYRLRQVDVDGRYTFSRVVAVARDAAAADLLLYPNPATDRLTVAWAGDTGEAPVQWMLVDAGGRVLRSGEMEGRMALGVGDLPAGMYAVRVAAMGKVVEGRWVRL